MLNSRAASLGQAMATSHNRPDGKPPTLVERIRAAFKPGERRVEYYTLARRVFPVEDYPRAWEYQSNGGPPGLVLTFSPALKRAGCDTHWDGCRRYVYVPVDRGDWL